MFPIRRRGARLLATAAFFSVLSTAASAENELSVAGNVGLVSDYRFRGISLSAEDIAVQGGLDLGYGMFYVGTWASSIESFNGSETEVDFYGGATRDLGGVTWSLGYYAYLYPGADNSNYVEVTGAAAKDFEVAAVKVGFNYAPKQDNIGDDDNIYLYGGATVPVPSTPLSLALGLAYENGAFGDDKLDWYIGFSAELLGLTWGARYIDTNAGDQFGTAADAAVVFSVGAAF